MTREEAIKRIDRLAQVMSEGYYDHLANGGAADPEYEDDIEALEWALITLKLGSKEAGVQLSEIQSCNLTKRK